MNIIVRHQFWGNRNESAISLHDKKNRYVQESNGKYSNILKVGIMTLTWIIMFVSVYADEFLTADEKRELSEYLTPEERRELSGLREQVLRERQRITHHGPEKVKLKVSTADGECVVDAVKKEYDSVDISIFDLEAANEAVEKWFLRMKERLVERKKKKAEAFKLAQPGLSELAEDFFSSLCFDNRRNMYIDKSIINNGEHISLRVKHFAWNALQDKIQKRDWIGSLNIAYDIVNNSSTFTTHYDMMPEKEELMQLFKDLEDHSFKVDVIPDTFRIVWIGDIKSVESVFDVPSVNREFMGFSVLSQEKIYISSKSMNAYWREIGSLIDKARAENKRLNESHDEREISDEEFEQRSHALFSQIESSHASLFLNIVEWEKREKKGVTERKSVVQEPKVVVKESSQVSDEETTAEEAKVDKGEFARVWSEIQPEDRSAASVLQNISRLRQGMENRTLVTIYDKYSDEKCAALLKRFNSEVATARTMKSSSERMVARETIVKTYKEKFLKALSKRLDDKIKSGAGTNGSAENSNNVPKDAQAGKRDKALSKCSDCNGTKYVKEEAQCQKCGGTGVEVKVKLGLNGTSRRVTAKCSGCEGTGIAVWKSPCKTCKGTGRVRAN